MKVEATHTIDVAEYAREIEKIAGSYLIPYERGLYIPLHGFPVIRASPNYDYTVVTSRDGLAHYSGDELYANPDLIGGDVYNDDGNLVVPGRSKNLLTRSPYHPHRTLLLINMYIERILISHFAYRRQNQVTTLEDLLLSALDKTQGFGSDMSVEKKSIFDELYATIDMILLDLGNLVYEILGEYRHHMHFSKLRDTMIIIERHIDYRIHYFNVKTNEGKSIDI